MYHVLTVAFLDGSFDEAEVSPEECATLSSLPPGAVFRSKNLTFHMDDVESYGYGESDKPPEVPSSTSLA